MLARLAAHRPSRLAFYALLALTLVWPALSAAALSNEFRDAQVLLLHERAAVDTVRGFGELPLWDPWYCGGIYALGAPQARFASPTFLASLAFGAERAEVVLAFLLAIVGMEGTFLWLRLRVKDALAVALVAPLFAMSGHVAVAFFRGWTSFWGFELVPLVLLGITLAARGRVSGVALASVAFAVILGFGGTFAVPLVAVAGTIEAARALVEARGRTRPRAAAMLLLTASFIVAAAFVRLLPVLDTLEAAPRIMAGTPGHSSRQLFFALVGRLGVNDGDVQLAGSFYVGITFIVLILLGGSDKKTFATMAVLVLLVWLAAGYSRKPALFALLRELPAMSALRYPERFLWLFVLFACEPAARALERIPQLAWSTNARRVATTMLFAFVAISAWGQISAFHHVTRARLLGTLAGRADMELAFRQSRGNRWLAAHSQAMNLGSLSCWEVHPVVQSPALRADLAREEYLDDPSAGAVKRTSFSPNRISVHAELRRKARLYVNQNWHRGWHAEPFAVVSDQGLLAVDLPEGTHDVTLRFAPDSARTGALVSGAAFIALALLCLRARRGLPCHAPGKRLVTAALGLAPWLMLGVAQAAAADPPAVPPVPRNADGAPALVAGMPADAAASGATFDVPVRVEGYRLRGPDARSNVALDVFLRRTGHLPRSTSVFVHVEHEDRAADNRAPNAPDAGNAPNDFFNADHQVVASSFYLADAPEGALVEDHVGVHLDKPAAGTWNVWIGFGHVSGRKGRAKIVDAKGALVNDGRLSLGSFEVSP